MKKIKDVWLNYCSYILFAAITLLSFSCAVDTNEDMALGENVQNKPYAKYTLEGEVVNQKGKAVPNIRIIIGELERREYVEWMFLPNTTYTNDSGEFYYSNENASPPNRLRIIYQDIDRYGNIGIYKTDSLDLNMDNLEGGNGLWYAGEALRKVKIILEEKKNEENK